MPRSDSALEGEVKGDVIFIYSEREQDAVQTLRHEFLDFLVSQSSEPYNELVNAQRLVITGLLNLIQEKTYQKKERLVERLELVLDALDTKESSA